MPTLHWHSCSAAVSRLVGGARRVRSSANRHTIRTTADDLRIQLLEYSYSSLCLKGPAIQHLVERHNVNNAGVICCIITSNCRRLKHETAKISHVNIVLSSCYCTTVNSEASGSLVFSSVLQHVTAQAQTRPSVSPLWSCYHVAAFLSSFLLCPPHTHPMPTRSRVS